MIALVPLYSLSATLIIMLTPMTNSMTQMVHLLKLVVVNLLLENLKWILLKYF